MDRVAAAISKARELQRNAAGPVPTGDGDPWQALSEFTPDRRIMALNRVVTPENDDPSAWHYEILRTKLLRLMRRNGWTSVGVTSPTSGCGKTTTCLNLAFSFARLALRTMLVDLDLRQGTVAQRLGLACAGSVAEVLRGSRPVEEVFVRHGSSLAIGAGRSGAREAGDLLQGAGAIRAIDDIRRRYAPEVMLFDLPPMLVIDDVLAFAPQLDCVLLVAGAEVSRLDEVELCMRELEAYPVPALVVVNGCRYGEGEIEYA